MLGVRTGIPSSALQAPVQNMNHSLTQLIALLSSQIESHDNADFYDALEVSYSAPLNLAQPGRGRKRYEITKDQVEHLRSLYFSWEAIADILQVSISTLKRQRKELGLSDFAYSEISDDELEFREEKIALMSNVEAMFHQVRVRRSDCDALRFLWWPDGNLDSQPEEYQMRVHLFGGASSPSCANFALKKTAEENKTDFNVQTVETVMRNFYVDDCLKSVPRDQKAINLADQLRKLALGVQWDISSDHFGFTIVIKDRPATRRGFLSIISSIYDPLGFVAPFILNAKLILQDLRRKKFSWDDPIPEDYLRRWHAWLQELPKLEDLKVDRCFKPFNSKEITSSELHHFPDASQQGFGTVTYLRISDRSGAVKCTFIMGKSRLAPIKTVTIPRLELSAAVIATRLDRANLASNQSSFWTDSTCVLRYIENQDKQFQTFVANRVATIHDASSPSQWKYVNTQDNPADDASRGVPADSL
ncbi:uncharacterized protein [Montipora foliosa]|uniref:uncharacterized protein n=1 Tax=Montipora foliosa TaxID=591990 RepID=UPI0035F1153E